MRSFKGLLILVIFWVFFTGCKEDSENVNYEIKDFIWHGLNEAYLWVDKVPDLSSSKYPNQASIDKFIAQYSDPEELFYDLLYEYGKIDKWSWIVDDYEELENYFQGITKSMGFEFDLGIISGTDNIFGVVLYVVKGGPADKAGLKRGDIFIKINDTQLTVNNYETLLFNTDSYKMGFATISGNSLYPSARTINMTAEEVHENPIMLDTVYNVNSTKIGYLVYNGFMSDYDIQLNKVFGDFKQAGIQKLVIDLRYNGGGAVTTATYLGSMIYGTYTEKVFYTTRYNQVLQGYLNQLYGNSFFSNNFANVIEPFDSNPETPINTLNLTEVIILTTGNTASASELLINGLKPYMNVVTIGTNTHGKYVGSITIKDYINNVEVNPKHKWALQPIVVKIADKNGVSDYVDGLAPTVTVKEDISDLRPFGDTTEIMLNTALHYINGNEATSVLKSKRIGYFSFISSKALKPHAHEMYIEEIPGLLRKRYK